MRRACVAVVQGHLAGEVVIGRRNDSSPVSSQTLLWDYAGQRARHVSERAMMVFEAASVGNGTPT